MPDVELVPDQGVPAEKGDDEEARQFILRVKKTIERCLEQRMNKAEMFRVIREEGLSTWIAFAVYKELREQNYGFFKEYYGMQDQKEQREKLGRLIQAYRTGRGNASLAAGAHAPETTTTTTAAAMETDTTDTMEWSGEQACFDEQINRLLPSSTGARGDDQFAGGAAALPQPAVPSPGGQQLHDDEQLTVYQEWLQSMTWAEEAAPTRQGMHTHEQSLANGMFQGHVYFPAGQQPGYLLEQAAQLPAGQQLHYQQQAAHLQAEQQLMYLQEQLMANGGFQNQGAPLTMAVAGLPSNNVMGSWPLPLEGIGWGRQQQGEPLLQRWPGSGTGSSPSPTLPGAELLGKHYQNFHRSNNAGFH